MQAEEVRLMPNNPMDLAKKVNFLFQVIMQATQTYLKNVELFICNSAPDKLLVLVTFIINASKICFDRNVFDKSDVLVMKMLRKCVEMKTFLERNANSAVKYYSMGKSVTNLYSNNSYSCDNKSYDKMQIRSKKALLAKKKNVKTKSPYEPPKNPYPMPKMKAKNSKSKTSGQNNHQKETKSVVHPKSPKIKKSTSNISTLVQKESEKQINENVERNVNNQKPKEIEELMEMLQNITKEKVHEMLGPLLSELVPKKIEESDSSDSNPVPQVTADTEPKIPSTCSTPTNVSSKTASSVETVQYVAPNVQYLYVMSHQNEPDEVPQVEEVGIGEEVEKIKEPSSMPAEIPKVSVKSVTCSAEPPQLPQLSNDSNNNEVIEDGKTSEENMKKLKQRALKERLKMIAQMMENPFYVNENISEPWKLLTKISNQLLDETITNIIGELEFGEKALVEKFLQHELAY
jgi:hypothetical protein